MLKLLSYYSLFRTYLLLDAVRFHSGVRSGGRSGWLVVIRTGIESAVIKVLDNLSQYGFRRRSGATASSL